jgi:predicted metal-dependent hydrolase
MASALKVRTPDFDFSETSVHWASNRELVQVINATNLVPACIEPFLIKVTRRARPLLDPIADAELLEDLEGLQPARGAALQGAHRVQPPDARVRVRRHRRRVLG